MAKKTRGRRPATKWNWRTIAHRISGDGHARWVVALRWAVVLGAAGGALGFLALFIAYKAMPIPNPNAEFLTQTTTVYYSDGKHVLGRLATQDRHSVPLDQVPDSMRNAVIAAEDRTFYSNQGIDFRGIVRALRDNTQNGEITGGGSTITQQYVKILYLTQERTYTRKLREALLAVKLHNQMSKEEILEGYLNTVYYGNGAYGVDVAAQTYFAKPASELDLAESVALATIINLPSYFDPYVEGGRERMLPRYNYVIDGMLKAGAISKGDAAKVRDKLPAFSERHVNNRYGGPNGFLLKMVEAELRDLQFKDSEINGQGLQVVSSFDYEKQKDALSAVQRINETTSARAMEELNRALVSVEPGTGAVRALYGGPDYVRSGLNWALLKTQPGSTFKVFGVVAGLQDGFSLKTKLNGTSPQHFPPDITIENQGDSGGRSYGFINLTQATQNSVNTAFIDLVRQMGDGNFANGSQLVLRAAQDLGIPESTIKQIDPVMVAVLGYAPVAPIDMANAYATLAAGGERAQWYTVESVRSTTGKVLHQHEVKTERVISERVAGDALVAMQAVVKGGTGRRAATICPVGGKTGTATAGGDKNQHVSSSWFIGTSPKLATAVMQNRGVGNEDLEAILGSNFIGGGYPAQMFKLYMDKALDRSDCGRFPGPGNISGSKGETVTPSASATLTCPPGYELKAEKCVPAEARCSDGSKPDLLGRCPDPTPTTFDPLDLNHDGQVSRGECYGSNGTWADGVCTPPPTTDP